MKLFLSASIAFSFALVIPGTGRSEPIIGGMSRETPLSDSQKGLILLGELNCFACHQGKESFATIKRTAPDLASVGSRVSPTYLKSFLESPSKMHSGSLMPELFVAEKPERRAEITEALTHYLVSLSPQPFQTQKVNDADSTAGKALFHSLGCVACHSPRDDQGKETIETGVVRLEHLPRKTNLAALESFLFQPLAVRPSGRMPEMKLTKSEAHNLASYLLGRSSNQEKPLTPNETLIAKGKQFFNEFRCTSCHQLPAETPVKPHAVDLTRANIERGCLSRQGGPYPRFHLTIGQIVRIQKALTEKSEPLTDKSRLAMQLTTFNCIACHSREGFGGVREDLNAHFRSTEKELGDEGRIPPPLTLIGAKLQPLVLKKVLFEGDSVRHYMLTRMPQFGESNLQALPELFTRLDHVKPVKFNMPPSEHGSDKERERERAMRSAGRELIGDKGLNCITCHSFNGKWANHKGMEMLTFPQRLNPAWFNQFVRDPNAMRPRIVMPSSWPDDVAVHKGNLNGDADRQIEAIWYYLTLGTSAAEPSGIRSADTLLTVTDAARTYRGRSSVAGFRGIAVGYPEQLHYAFNAETGTLSAIWKGDFIRVNRSGQGSGGFQPAGRFVALDQDVSFYALPDKETAWPLRPVMTKEAPVNPDPLYPKNRGYQFKGYVLGDQSIPTFMYRSGDIDIEDSSRVKITKANPQLVRTFRFQSPKAQTIWFRALTGPVESISKTQFQSTGVRLGIPELETVLRTNPTDAKSKELLLKLDLPAGASQQTLTYELKP
ncbi:MAG: cytochrome c [Gemmataceae bacterium]